MAKVLSEKERQVLKNCEDTLDRLLKKFHHTLLAVEQVHLCSEMVKLCHQIRSLKHE